MFGLGGAFLYGSCVQCGALTLRNPPAMMEMYYPPDKYYSLGEGHPDWSQRPEGWRGLAARATNEFKLFRRNLVGAGKQLVRSGNFDGVRDYRWNLRARASGAKILDVGCGAGQWLHSLANLGFKNLWGIDPYLSTELEDPPRIHLLRRSVSEFSEKEFDFINLSHSLEHMADHRSVFSWIRQALSPKGLCRIEIPVCDSDAFSIYRERWIELDAPRHLVLHTNRSISHLAAESGLRITRIAQTGFGLEYWGSEFYLRGLTYYDYERGRLRNPSDVFSVSELSNLKTRARESSKRDRSGRRAYYFEVA